MEVRAEYSEMYDGWYIVIVNHNLREMTIKFNDFFPTKDEAIEAFKNIPTTF